MSLTAPERETIITLNDEDDTAHIYTAQRRWITKLKKNPKANLPAEGKHECSAWAEFEIPADLIAYPRATRRRLTAVQKQALAEGRARTAA
jgi:hypothetical protein